MPERAPTACARRRRPALALAVVACVLLACLLQGAPASAAPPPVGPTASFTFAPTAPKPGQAVSFTSTSTDATGQRITGPNTYWDFGDSSANATTHGISVQHTFATAGVYSVRLTVDDGNGAIASTLSTVRVRTPIVPSFQFSPVAPQAYDPVTFTSTSTGGDAPLTSSWSFGDGSASVSGTTVVHAFAAPIAHTVTLTVSDGTQTEQVSRTVVGNRPPDPAFTVYPLNPQVGQPIYLTSYSSDPDDPIVSQQWDLNGDGVFGDAAGPITSTIFNVPGIHVVQLRVYDARGAVAQGFVNVPVSARAATPAPSPKPIAPFPIVRVVGIVSAHGARLRVLTVRAPAGVRIRVSCSGHSCPHAHVTRSVANVTTTLHFAAYERFLRGGTTLTVRATMSGRIGKYTRLRIRSGRAPEREDACLKPGATSPSSCPS